MKKISILFLALILICSSAFSVKLTVPSQYRKIQTALLNAKEGDTVYVGPGIYKENIVMVDYVVLRGADQKTTILNGSRKGPVVTGADNCEISNFTIRNGTYGIECAGTAPVIKDNIIIDNKGSGIMAIMGLPEIKNNIIMRNEWSGVFCQSVKALNTAIENNVIIENGYSGIYCANITTVLIKNNIIANNDEFGVYCDLTAKRSRIVYNNFLANMTGHGSYHAVMNKTNISRDPMFNTPEASIKSMNYFVKPVSPMKNAGENNVDIGLLTEEKVKKATLDSDNDGIPDDVDLCPQVPEDKDGFEDSDGCPDYDNDKDGIFDLKDKCPNEPEDKDGFEDMDGCPDYDNDNDGIPDTLDDCPTVPETINGYKDDDGCPDEKPQEITKKLILPGITFKPGSDQLLDDAYPVLDQVFNSLEAFPNVRVEIGGHTDSQGASNYNMLLSRDRARSVKRYLVSRGIAEHRLLIKGYGEARPIATNRTPEGRKQNRRIEFKRIR
ncbi:MAG: OmpA family protein [Fibrobacterota bacterium]